VASARRSTPLSSDSLAGRPADFRPVRIGGAELGTGPAVVCIPIVAETPEQAHEQALQIGRLGPDLIELRADYLQAPDSDTILGAIAAVRAATALPILLTLRRPEEGGRWRGEEADRIAAILAVARAGVADAVDLERAAGPFARRTLREALGGRPLVLSSHHLAKTPPPSTLVIEARGMARSGDLVKIATMAREPADGLRLLVAADHMRRTLPVPFIAIAMGPAGAFTRAVAPLFGSSLTFASGVGASAPGQFDIEKLRQALALFER
jgi:3-dehydroquinate dehydratase-1